MEQVHCQNWPDLQAPKDSSVLLDMCEVVEDLMGEDPGFLLVHCSAGVGRTGAFIGLYKLIKDFKNKANETRKYDQRRLTFLNKDKDLISKVDSEEKERQRVDTILY